MMIRSLLALFLLCLSLPAQPEQGNESEAGAEIGVETGDPTAAEAVFYRAFYLDKGERKFVEAIEQYRRFLGMEPSHRLAVRAARSARQLLLRVGRKDDAEAFAAKHRELLTRAPKSDRRRRVAGPLTDELRALLEQRLVGLKEQFAVAESNGDDKQMRRLGRSIKAIEARLEGRRKTKGQDKDKGKGKRKGKPASDKGRKGNKAKAEKAAEQEPGKRS